MDKDSTNPKSVGIIMDGNRRWAEQRGLPKTEGHRYGYEVFKKFLEWSKELGITNLFVYAFSSENWNRSKEEVDFLLMLSREMLPDRFFEELSKNNAKVKFAGDIEKFPEDIYKKMLEIEEKTKDKTERGLVMCVSYGGRDEITSTFNRILKNNPDIKEITKKDIEDNLYTAGFKDPDLIIRTSGEQRVSGFLPWQSVYSELFFTKTLWPDFTKEELVLILEEFKKRERRIGR
jgi:undecaprenyl diphosphate synthase